MLNCRRSFGNRVEVDSVVEWCQEFVHSCSFVSYSLARKEFERTLPVADGRVGEGVYQEDVGQLVLHIILSEEGDIRKPIQS